jgi:uncharacterized LabA/DUF88 family protein
MPVDSGLEKSPPLYSTHQPGGQVSSDKGSQPETEAAPFSSERPFRVGWYIDGFNLYHAVDALDEPVLKWLNVHSLAASYLRPDQTLERVVFSTAYNTWDAGKRERHIQYVNALKAVGVEVILAKFDKVQKYCRRHERYCKFYEEKQSDVNLAVEALSDVYDGKVDTVFFLTADSDQIPTFQAIQRRFPNIRIHLVAPPGRLGVARDLAQYANAKFELTAGRLRLHPLEVEYRNGHGNVVAQRPTEYEQSA